jgi:hypothetical protein
VRKWKKKKKTKRREKRLEVEVEVEVEEEDRSVEQLLFFSSSLPSLSILPSLSSKLQYFSSPFARKKRTPSTP